MAVANYHEVYGCFPPAFVAGPDGRPWHSWRVLILPYLEQQVLYDSYNFAEPWDGANNRMLAGKAASIYLRPGVKEDESHTTSFVAVVGPGTAWPGARALARNDFGDGTMNTLMVVEVPNGRFPWMAPRDLAFDRMSFRINDGSGRGLGSPFGGARVNAADGMVYTLPDDFDPARLRALLTANGGEPVTPP